MASAALFIAKHHNDGVTEYISRKTGERYRLVPEDGGLYVETPLRTHIWTTKLVEALRIIETLDAQH